MTLNCLKRLQMASNSFTFADLLSGLLDQEWLWGHRKRASIRNSFPFGMAFHSEWLWNNPKGHMGPSPPRAPKAPLGPLGARWVPLGPFGSLWVPLVPQVLGVPRGPWGVGWGWGPWGAFGSKGSAPCRSEKRASREFGGGATLPEKINWVGGMRFSVYGFLID